MIKVLTIVGTRPEIIKLSCIIHELEKCTNHILVHTGQNFDYELNEIFFKQLGLKKPDYFLGAAGNTPAETIANVIKGTDEILVKENPDAFLIYGDTNSCLSVIAAKRRKIPVFHLEAGNRCFDQRVPEENNRKIVDHLSDINITLSEHARRNLLNEGLLSERIFKTGSPMKEVIAGHIEEINRSGILNELKVSKGEYFIVSSHREENVDDKTNLRSLIDTVESLHRKYRKKILVSTHPRTRKRLEQFGIEISNPDILFLKPFGFIEYIRLMMDSLCVISDSGTLTEESSVLGLNAVMIRNAHERPEGMDEGAVIMCGLESEKVLNAVGITLEQSRNTGLKPRLIKDYDTENVSLKVVRIIHSYYDYINKKVWFK